MFPELKRYTSFAILLGIVALGASGLDAVRSTHEAQVAAVSSAAAETTNTANSVSAELGKLTGSLYQNAPAPQNTRAPEAAQLAAASSRAALMKNLAETNPAAFLGYALPLTVRAKLSKLVQTQVEEQKTLTGTIDVLHADDFDHPENSTFKYFLNVGGKHLSLYAAQDLPALLSGSELTIKGYQLGDIVVTVGGPAEITVRKAAKPESVGKQRLLVVLVSRPSGPPTPSPQDMKKLIFSGPFAKFFEEQSYGKVSFAGDVTDWISFNYPSDHCQTNVLGAFDFDTPEIRAYILEKKIDLAKYDRAVFVPSPDFYPSCSTLGKQNVLFNGTTYRLSLSWKGWSDSLDVGYPIPSTFAHVLAHEMGHALGVMHANGWWCFGPSLYENCNHDEYANWFDVMGAGSLAAHFNAFYKDFLGWLAPKDKKIVTKTGTYTLTPLETANGVRAIILKNPAIATGNLAGFSYLEFRQPIGFDATLPADDAGIFINYPFTSAGS